METEGKDTLLNVDWPSIASTLTPGEMLVGITRTAVVGITRSAVVSRIGHLEAGDQQDWQREEHMQELHTRTNQHLPCNHVCGSHTGFTSHLPAHQR